MSVTRKLLLAAVSGLALLSLAPTAASAVDLHIGWQQIVEPSRVPQAAGDYEKATGANITWSQFSSGADVVAAIASGSIDIGYVGSLAADGGGQPAAADRDDLHRRQHRRGRGACGKGCELAAGSRRKKIATPFVSTSHYALLAALKHWNIDPKSLSILNLKPADIGAAWTRGDIDGAYVVRIRADADQDDGRQGGRRLGAGGAMGFADLRRLDRPQGLCRCASGCRHSLREGHGRRLQAVSRQSLRRGPDSDAAKAIAKLTGADAKDVPELLKGYVFPSLADEAGPNYLGGATTKAITDTAAFLVAQGKYPAALPDYSAYVTTKFVVDAAK